MKAFKLVALLLLCSVSTQAQTAKLYFIRSTGMSGVAVGFSAFVDDTLKCKLNNKRYSVHDITPGEHTITVRFYGKKSNAAAEPLKMNFEAGKTYYVQMVYQTKFLTENLYPQEVTENSAKMILPECKLDGDCKVD